MTQRPPRALVVDTDADVRTLLVRALQQQGFRCDAVADGKQAADLANATHYDVLVTELALPGLNGHALIRHFLKTQYSLRVVVLTSVEQPVIFKDLMARGVRDIYLKPIDCTLFAAEVKDLVEEHAGASAEDSRAGQNAIPATAVQLAAACPLPDLPAAVIDLLQIQTTGADTPSADPVARRIDEDAATSVLLLRLAEHPALQLPKKADSVADAVALLGVDRTVSLILAATVIDRQQELLWSWNQTLRDWYRQRCVLNGCMTGGLATAVDGVSPERAFMLGLLQDIGVLVIANDMGDYFIEQIVERSRQMEESSLIDLERSDLQVTHAEAAAALLARWKVPNDMIVTVLHHHAKQTLPESHIARHMIPLMQMAEVFADFVDGRHQFDRARLSRLLSERGHDEVDKLLPCFSIAMTQALRCARLWNIPMPDPRTFATLVGSILSATNSSHTGSIVQ